MFIKEKNIYQCKKCSLIFLKGKNLKKQLDNIYFTKKYTSQRKNFHIDSKTIGRQNIPTYKSLA